METLFSREEISQILTEANINQSFYLGAHVVDGNSNEKSIITISENKQIIFVKGNDHTGFKHLRDRHNLFSFKNYWVLDNEKGFRLDKPSKFHPKMAPIVEYVKIAEAIFEECNKNVTNNKRPEEFDKYTGTYCFESEKTETYHLLTYKDTKIVHSLFPDKKTFNKKIKTKYGKGFVSTTTIFPEAYNDLVVPYENERGNVAYSILIRKFYNEGIERTFIQKHNINGIAESRYQLAERTFTDFESFDRADINRYQLSDLNYFENIIEKIDNDENKQL